MSKILGVLESNYSKGFVFSLEAAVATLLFILMLSALPQQKSGSAKELALTQQADDLLRVWSAKTTNEQEMITDTKLVFQNNAAVFVNDKQILSAEQRKNNITTQGVILDDGLNEQKIQIRVYYD